MSEPMLIALACLIAGLTAGALIVFFTRPKAAAIDPMAEAQKLAEAQRNLEALSNLNTRLDDMAKWLHGSHGQLKQTMDTRLDAVTARLGESLSASANTTAEHLQNLHARLAVIDSAQKNIGELATQVTSLQQILSNKQSRGAFGQAQLEALIADVLPKGAYAFQHKLSNGKMPDCAIFMPDKSALIIDAKFPLEAVTSLRNAANDEERKAAHARIRTDLGKHIGDIAERYFVPGETQDIALMFIPSESVYAEIHERFEDVVQRAHRARVMIVSPTLMVMAIQVIKQVRKDAQMREAVDQIRAEVGHMMKDVGLLGERVNKLKTHFAQSNKDIDDILTSTGRIEKRAGRIEGLEFDDANAGEVLPGPGRIQAAE